MATHVLISGGSGLLGREIAKLLVSAGYKVAILSRHNDAKSFVPTFTWDYEKEILAPEALPYAENIIHLAGAGIADQRWSRKRQREIIYSRTESIAFLMQELAKAGSQCRTLISASAIGYYGGLTSEHIFTEEDDAADDFLGTSCRLWETAVDKSAQAGSRVVKLRLGVVLSRAGGAIARLAPIFGLGFGSPVGSGRQYMPWVHIADAAEMFHHALANTHMRGVFNAIAPQHVTNRQFAAALASAMGKPYFMPPVPSFALRLAFGEMATTVLAGSRVSAAKIQALGFSYQFAEIDAALKDLFS
jgi:uncharacterized protein (TIGR01777 family)